jgi:dynein assembly factor with WDR repeat domains 1
VQEIAADIARQEPDLGSSRLKVLERLVQRLQLKLAEGTVTWKFQLLRAVHNAHSFPLTNCAFNKSGDKFITGSYDRTCKVFDTKSGSELHVLEGHKNVVFAVAFNNPYGDKILTGSFDKTAKLWDAASGTFTMNSRRQAGGNSSGTFMLSCVAMNRPMPWQVLT